MSVRVIIIALLSVFCWFSSFARGGDSAIRLMPDFTTHKRFLMSEWKPGAPSLIAIKDPMCGYCIRDLKRRVQLQNYNVFLFWAPILSKRSVTRVDEFFRCDNPVEARVLNAAIERTSPRCAGVLKQNLLDLNNEMVASYNPNSIPQYWFGGQRVRLASLNLFRPTVHAETIAKKSALKLNWSRYQSVLANEPLETRHNIAVVLPDSYPLKLEVVERLSASTLFNWYLFSDHFNQGVSSRLWCTQYAGSCDGQITSRGADYANKEFRLLAGLDSVSEPILLLEGKPLSDREISFLVPSDIQAFLGFSPRGASQR